MIPTVDFDFNGSGNIDGIEIAFIWLMGITAILIAIGSLIVIARNIGGFFGNIGLFFDDWFGKPENKERGEPEVPGVPKRMGMIEVNQLEMRDKIEATQADVAGLRQKVDHELSYNHGTSTKDRATKAEALAQKAFDGVGRIEKAFETDREERIARQNQLDGELNKLRKLWFDALTLLRGSLHLSQEEQIRLWDQFSADVIRKENDDETV